MEDLELDISHESLMRIWQQLKVWIAEEAESARLLKELLVREKNNYLTTRLPEYLRWRDAKKPGIAWASLYRPADMDEETYKARFDAGITLIDDSKKRQTSRTMRDGGPFAPWSHLCGGSDPIPDQQQDKGETNLRQGRMKS